MKAKMVPKAVRRSVALPRSLVEEIVAAAPEELRHNLNRLVIVSLQEYVQRRRALVFEEALAEMAQDPAVQAECAAISKDFAGAERDGLRAP